MLLGRVLVVLALRIALRLKGALATMPQGSHVVLIYTFEYLKR